MYIEKIQSPADLKQLDLEALKIVAEETRRAVLNRVSKHGGHVGPTWVSWRQRWPSIMYSTRQRTSLCLTFHTNAILTRCLLVVHRVFWATWTT